MQAYNKKGSTSSFIAEKAPKPRQLLSMTLHLGYPTVIQGHWLIGLTPIARTNKAHKSHPCSKNHPNPALDQTQTNHTPLIV
jgi:hypothetical protein